MSRDEIPASRPNPRSGLSSPIVVIKSWA
jgi:hypothetical protein